LQQKGMLDDAIDQCKKALAIDPKIAQPHAALGMALLERGRFDEAHEEMQTFQNLLPPGDRLRDFATDQLKTIDGLLALDKKRQAILKGDATPADGDEALAMAQLSQATKKQYAAAARFYGDAFTAKPELAKDPSQGLRYNAACAAAQAAAGQGDDAQSLGDK